MLGVGCRVKNASLLAPTPLLPLDLVHKHRVSTPGSESGYGDRLPPYGTAYRRALRTTRTRFRNRIPNQH